MKNQNLIILLTITVFSTFIYAVEPLPSFLADIINELPYNDEGSGLSPWLVIIILFATCCSGCFCFKRIIGRKIQAWVDDHSDIHGGC